MNDELGELIAIELGGIRGRLQQLNSKMDDRLVLWAIVEQLERISVALYVLVPDCERESLQDDWNAINEKFALRKEVTP